MLKKLENNKLLPMHMPGHKRNVNLAPFLKKLRADLDITEIDGFDNLANPEEMLKDTMNKASKIWGSEKTYLLVGGSTCGILAGFKTFTNEGDCVLMCRNSHKSMYNALELFGLNARFISGEIYNSQGKYELIDPQEIEKNLNENKVNLVAITSPNYEGYVQDIKSIAKICHKYNVPLLVDEAHGSHLGFNDYFESSAVKNGADFVVQSLHKTLLGLTQTAICHANGKMLSLKKLEHNLSVFQSSSPSYLLLSSICECVNFVEDKRVFETWVNILKNFYKSSLKLKHLKINTDEKRDKSKILIDCSNTNINGKELMKILREKHSIELEMACANYAIAMTGLGDTAENLEKLLTALLEIDSELSFEKKEVFRLKNFQTKPSYTIKKAINAESTLTTEPVGKISATHLWVYPPGIPVVIAGEKITEEQFELIKTLEKQNSVILDTEKNYPNFTICR